MDVGGPYKNIQKSVEQAEEELGPVYLLVNCAGFSRPARFEDLPIEEFQVPFSQLAVVFFLCRYLLAL